MAKPARIVLIHATSVAVEPIVASFRGGWPEAEIVNILDDGLPADRAKDPGVTPQMFQHFSDLTRYARNRGADGVLFTCSAFGPAIEQAAKEVSIPVLKPNEAMFEQAMNCGRRIGMIATFAPALASMEEEFASERNHRKSNAELKSVVVPAAMDALRAGDVDGHNRLVAEGVSSLPAVDAIMLAHFSTSRAAPAVSRKTAIPVLTAPDAAVSKIRRLVSGSD